MSDKMFTIPGIKANRISARVDTSKIGQTADWSSIGEGIAQAGANIGAGIQARKTNLSITEEQLKNGKQPVDKLQARIDKATAQGKDARAARLTGRKERRDERDTARAERITQRNVERKAQTTKRQEEKNKKFKARRAGADNKYETKEDNTVPASSFAQVFDKFSTIAKNL